MLPRHFQENKERLQEKVLERHQNLSEEKKNKKHQYGCEQYKNLHEDQKESLVQSRKKLF